MFDFSDKETSEYKNYSIFVDDETNEPRNISSLNKTQFPYPFVETVEPQKIFKQENLLTKEECEYLIWLAETHENWNKGTLKFWEERNMGFFAELQAHKFKTPELQKLSLDIHDRIKKFISDSFGVEVYADQIGIVRWLPDSWQMTHIDAVHDFDRVAGSVVFLNDDYEGGEPFYPYYGIKTKPEQGMVYAHDVGHSHLHGVTKIRNKTRYTISSTWTKNPSQNVYRHNIENIQRNLYSTSTEHMNENQKLTAQQRFAMCQACPRFFKPTGQCKECGCFMRVKTRMPEQVCPLGKW